jgi:hypothetical protein
MKELLFAISAATLLVAAPAAFAAPSEEAAGDYTGWRDATRVVSAATCPTLEGYPDCPLSDNAPRALYDGSLRTTAPVRAAHPTKTHRAGEALKLGTH